MASLLFGTMMAAAILSRGQTAKQPPPLAGPDVRRSSEYVGRVAVEAPPPPEDARKPITFYVYRAGSKASYPLDNVNAADLAGVMWYLHNEVVVSTPRKYGIDRIRRFKLSIKNTQEFWNVHHRNFGAFLAFDAARCTTPICGNIFSQYGFIVGCQVLPIDVAPYLGSTMTQVNGACKGKFCNAPVWYSLPGACPIEGLSNDEIAGNTGDQDVMKAKGAKCLKEQPGGRCEAANGAPDCTFSYEEAGEIMLDELVGIKGSYDFFWNGSHAECEQKVKSGLRKGPCRFNKEFDVESDRGVGCSFWDHKADSDKAAKRMKAVRDMFKKHHPEMPYDLEEPACDFDMYYDGEEGWPTNHSGATPPGRGFSWEKAMDMRKTTTMPPLPAGAPDETCKELGCGSRGSRCDCNDMCHKYNDCCADYTEQCPTAAQLKAEKEEEEEEEDEEQDKSILAEIEAADRIARLAAPAPVRSSAKGAAPKPASSKAGSSRSESKAGNSSESESPKTTKACTEAKEACDKAVTWARTDGFYGHPEWYKGLTASSTDEDFGRFLAKTKHGSCDKVCTGMSAMLFRKK